MRDCVAATRAAVATNTNLGSVLLTGTTGNGARGEPLRTGVEQVLANLDAHDARLVYEAIRLAQPGGMGRVEEADVTGPAPADLRHAMQLAADRDLIARQYTNGLADVFEVVVPAIQAGVAEAWPLADTIVYAHLKTMSRHPDSLIARKCGAADRRASRAHRRASLAGRAAPAIRHITRRRRISISGCVPTVIAATQARRPTW